MTFNHLLSWIASLATQLPIWLSGVPVNDKVYVTMAASALVGLVHIGEGLRKAPTLTVPTVTTTGLKPAA